jgi:hypothetical protein
MLSAHGAGPNSFPGGSPDFGAESIGSGKPGYGSPGGPDSLGGPGGSASHRCAACRHYAACRGERARREGGGCKEGR